MDEFTQGPRPARRPSREGAAAPPAPTPAPGADGGIERRGFVKLLAGAGLAGTALLEACVAARSEPGSLDPETLQALLSFTDQEPPAGEAMEELETSLERHVENIRVVRAYPVEQATEPSLKFRPLPRAALALAALLSMAAGPALAQEAAPEPIVTTRHEMTLDGRTLSYTAHAGRIPIRDNEAGDVHGRMFFMAYTLERAPGEPPRPLTFVWNGGPGMNSSLIHLLGFGPRRVKSGDAFPTSPPLSETEMVDNQETWLDWTDLVFVDPIGTGYSRPEKPEYASEFYQTPGDIEAVTEFIRVYRVRFDAWDAPLFIVGHSYGTTRAMGVADALLRRGIPLEGVALLSGGFSVGQEPRPDELSTALAVPGMTAVAFYHGRLADDLQGDLDAALEEAGAWARETYAPALSRLDALSDAERGTVLEGLARYTGLDADGLDPSTLAVERDDFRNRLLRDTVLGRYDARMKRPARPGESGYDIFIDPSFEPALGLVQGTSPALNRYLRFELGYETDLLYNGPLGGEYPPVETLNRRFNRNRAEAEEDAGEPPPQPPLRRALDRDPSLRVFVARGLYDSGSCFTHLHDVERLEPDLASRVSVGCYGAGHDFYTDRSVRQEIERDMRAFVQRTLGTSAARGPSH